MTTITIAPGTEFPMIEGATGSYRYKFLNNLSVGAYANFMNNDGQNLQTVIIQANSSRIVVSPVDSADVMIGSID